jgi:hypothetical protein
MLRRAGLGAAALAGLSLGPRVLRREQRLRRNVRAAPAALMHVGIRNRRKVVVRLAHRAAISSHLHSIHHHRVAGWRRLRHQAQVWDNQSSGAGSPLALGAVRKP